MSGRSTEPVPLQGVPSLRPNINCQSPVNRNCFYNLAVHLPEGRGPQSGPATHRQESKMFESWQREAERRTQRGRDGEKNVVKCVSKELGVPLSLLFSFAKESNFLLSDFFLFCPSVPWEKKRKKQQENKSSETNGFHICSILSGLFYLISLCQECRCELTTGGGGSCLWTQIHLAETPDRVSHGISHPKKTCQNMLNRLYCLSTLAYMCHGCSQFGYWEILHCTWVFITFSWPGVPWIIHFGISTF